MHPKNEQKTIPSKNHFFSAFWLFSGFFIYFFINFGSQKGSREGPFSMFFSHRGLRRFFCVFSWKSQKREKQKTSFRIVNYSVLWDSPCRKKHAMCWKTALEKASIFSSKSYQNRWKNRGKLRSRPNSSKKCSLARLFEEKVDFGSIFGSPPGPKMRSKINLWNQNLG